jgi:hypothetical protein
MKTLVFITLMLFPSLSFSQLDTESQLFFDGFFGALKSKDIVIFSDEINKGDLKKMMDAVSSKTIHLYRLVLTSKTSPSLKSRDTISLSIEEKKYLLKELNKMSAKFWFSNISPSTRLISEDSINTTFKNIVVGWTDFHKRYGSCYYRFSKPIFIRGNSLCFFYHSVYVDFLNAEGVFGLYKKENGVWKYYMTIWEWIS